MQVSVKTTEPQASPADLLALPILQRTRGETRALTLAPTVRAIDRELGGIVSAAVESGDFRASAGQTLVLYPTDSSPVQRVLLVGLGKESGVTADGLRRAAGTAARRSGSRKNKRVSFWLPKLRNVDREDAVQAVSEGAVLGSYRFDHYRDLGESEPGTVRALSIFLEKGGKSAPASARKAANAGRVIAESQNIARDLSNQPGNELPPAKLASEARKIARETGLKCQVMDVAELKRRKMGGILAVGAGSSRPPRLIVLEHRPKKARTQTVCLVGKGVTFDSGGISIKPSAGMEEMKHDMSGAAAVIGAMRAIALLGLPVHVVGVIGAAENLPSATAYRPGDVVRTASGKTIEVLNTDAEGRVVLADALHYGRTHYKPDAMIDLATLTGACMVALGPWATGLFGTDDDLVEKVREAGEACGERAWPMPLFDGHRRAVKSTIADVKNTAGRDAGASTAAAFLAAFTGDTPWVHLDIAGTGWSSAAHPYQVKGGTGVGVRLLLELLRGWK